MTEDGRLDVVNPATGEIIEESGVGRELGREGLEAFQGSKHVHIDPRVEKKDWWYPYGKGEEPGRRVM